MGRFEDFKKNSIGSRELPAANPTVQYELQEPIARMVDAWGALDTQVQDFLERVADDEEFVGIFDVNEEWRCWMEMDKKNSCILFDESLEVFNDKAYEHFVKNYGDEWKDIRKQVDDIGKMGKGLDEYKLFKAALYNVFNNKNKLPVREYFDQVYTRAHEYNMDLDRHSKHDMDLMVTFKPLDEVNRGKPYLEYKLRMAYNPTFGRDGYVYSVRFMDAKSAETMYSGPTELPILGQFEKFEERVSDHFLNTEPSLFHFEAVREKRMEEKEKYNIPPYYYEATYLDASKLVNYSDKSYQYGHSSVFIPKSQVAMGGDKLYVNRWLFYKLREEVMALNERTQSTKQTDTNEKSDTVESVLKDAEERCDARNDAGERIKDKEERIK